MTKSLSYAYPSLIALTALTLVLTPAIGQMPQGQNPPAADRAIAFRDVRLSPGGQMKLTVLSAEGKPLPEKTVTVLYREGVICRSKTTAKGVVHIKGLRPGLHVLQVANQSLPCRLWNAKTAPPTALANPAFVVADTTIRGQYGPMGGPVMPMMAPAALATGVTAAALAAVIVGKSSGSDNDIVLPASP